MLRRTGCLHGNMHFKLNWLSPRKQAVYTRRVSRPKPCNAEHNGRSFCVNWGKTKERAKSKGLKEEGRCGSTAAFRFTIMTRALTNIQGAPAQGRPTVSCFAATENSVGPFDSRVGPLSCRNVLTDTALLWSQTYPTASYSNKQTTEQIRIRSEMWRG